MDIFSYLLGKKEGGGGSSGGFVGIDYTELEYIDSTGTQYIDTGIVPSADLTIKITGNQNVNSGGVFGCTTSDESVKYFLASNSYKLTFYYTNNYYKSSIDYNAKTDIEINATSIKMNDNTVHTFTISVYPVDTMYLFAANNNNVAVGYSQARIYSFQVYDGNTLIMDLKPVRVNPFNCVCFYDSVTNSFFTNSGTGTFTAGPEKE